MKISVQHIVDWKSGESYFAIVRGMEVLKALRECRNWTEARVAYRSFVKGN